MLFRSVSVKPNTWKQPEVDGDFIQVNLADEGQTREKTPKGVTSPSDNTQGMSEEHRFDVECSKLQFVPTPSVGTWERSSRIRPQSKQENFTIGETVTAKSPPGGDMENRSEERLDSRSDDECSDHSLTKSSSRTPPLEGGKQAGPPLLKEVPSKPYIFKQAKPASRKGKEIQEPEPTEIKSHSDLSFRPLQSTPGSNPFSTAGIPISVGSTQQSPQDKSQSIKPVGKSVDTDNSLDIREAISEIKILSSSENPSLVVASINDKVELSITPAENRSMEIGRASCRERV